MMQVVYVVAVCVIGNVVLQCSAHASNITKRQTHGGDKVVHSPLKQQNHYPNNPIMLEAPSHFSTPGRLLRHNAIEDYIVGGYKKWGGYDKAMFQKDGSVILEFDMKISREEYVAYYSGDDKSMVQSSPPLDSPMPRRKPVGPKGGRTKRKALVLPSTRWPGGVIPYDISIDYSEREVEIIKQSMEAWEKRTCVRFVPSQPYHKNVLQIQSERGCNSFVGMVGGVQQMNLEKDCRVEHVITHELGHVIGLIHEHQRNDRDSFIRILSQNVGFNKLKNFRKFRPERVSNFGVEYDYTSIMHYGKYAFSKDDKSVTMVTLDPRFQDIIGHTTTISFSDAKTVNVMYNCARACKSVAISCGSGYLDHNCHCVCQDGTDSCSVQLKRSQNKMIHGNGRQRVLTHQTLLPQPDVYFPGIHSSLIQTPPMFRNIFRPGGQVGKQPNFQVGNMFLTNARSHIRQNPNMYGRMLRPVSQKATLYQTLRGNQFYRPAVFYPAQRFGSTPAGQSVRFGNQGMFQLAPGQQGRFQQARPRYFIFPTQTMNRLPRIRRELDSARGKRRYFRRAAGRQQSSPTSIYYTAQYS